MVVALAVVAVAAAVPSLGGAEGSPAAAGTFPGRNGLLTFARSTPDGFDIVAMRRDGSHRRVLVKSPADSVSLYSDWSPDGRHLAFDSDRTGKIEVFLRRPGGEIKQLTEGPAEDTHPTWAPGGLRIAFESDRSGSRQIHVMDKNGTNVRRVTRFTPGAEEPSFSPTGRWIAFLSGKV
ncbi:MAG: hypothetical protein M3Q87_11465, partial [Actinomycetota bacterium]|nr:hypothetical protein [Actinomycetota bacterium]